jgi:hypothetical protein
MWEYGRRGNDEAEIGIFSTAWRKRRRRSR